MFLKRLEIVGFKSFADRITIDFVPGVTAVVGPNGSGKSNITDAVRWVLGEQSAKSLRGGKMEDVIFAGSDSRKPLNFAEVSLTLDNEDQFLPVDYQEVCITRRIFRSGESEYLINKQPCRLKDIVDLLLDSGLGRDSFSIIGQGKVEEILNSKPEERRSIFEEAAGVLKYKTRKKKAEIKLSETEDNLTRIQDIIHELEGQLEPLKTQAAAAKDYLQKKDELQMYEISLLVYEIEQLHSRWEDLKARLEKMMSEEMELATQIQVKEADITEYRNKITALDESIDELQHVLLITSEELKKLEGKQKVLKERKKNAEQMQQQLEEAIRDGKEKLSRDKSIIKDLEEKKSRLEKELRQKREKLREYEETLSYYSEDLESKIESLKSDYIEYLNEEAAVKNDERHVEQQINQLTLKKESLFKDHEQFILEREKIHAEKEKLQQELDKIQRLIEETTVEYRIKERQLENIGNHISKKEKKYYEALQYLQNAQSRKEILEDMKEDYSGFYQGVKAVLKARNRLTGIEGAVIELINVEKTYETAIDIALSASQQYIVVQTEEDARNAIRYLKKHGSGRATFLPMSVIQPKKIPEQLLHRIKNHPGFIGVASDLISYHKKYDHVILNLLGNVIICRDLEGANEISSLSGRRYRIVTLDGDVVNPGGSMTGGAQKKNKSSLFSRTRELESLKHKLTEMETECKKLENEIKEKKKLLKTEKENLSTILSHGETLREQQGRLKDQLKEIKWNEKNIQDRLHLFDNEIKIIDQELKELQNKKEQNVKQLGGIREKIKELDATIRGLSEKKSFDQSKKSVLTEEINGLKVSIAKLEEQLHHTANQLSTAKKNHAELEERIHEQTYELNRLRNYIEMNSDDDRKLAQEAEQKLSEKNDTVELIAERRNERLVLQQKSEDLEREVKELKRQHKETAQMLKNEEVKLSRLDLELENRLETLREKYTLSFEKAKKEYPLTAVPEEVREKVEKIRTAIQKLGTVNLGAIDEYERVHERYRFLTEQQEDLQAAKETLYQVIEEMDAEMMKRFNETFTAIQSQFNQVFQSLFGGGRAELKLTDPDDILNTGVEIVAQPPGKKLQNLGLLSGGERALTAIALLFSILKVRPVPFCILDEVEAALDEANVYRFSQFLKKFSEKTQFIIITHRKGTMEGANVLYGVTMQESGVSKLVSVRLEDVVDAG